MSEEETREQIEEIINNNNEEPIKEEVKQEEPIKEEVKQEIKPKTKAKSKAKPKQIKITKEPVEPVQKIEEYEGVSRDPPDGRGKAPSSPVVEEPVVEEPVVEEKPKKIDKLKEIVKCPDCNLEMTQHTLKYIHKRRGFCKAEKKPEVEEAPQPEQPKTKITEDIVNDYIKENPDIISNYLRNERALKAQRKQMNARSLLNNAF
jgi:hypothetical protein